MDKLTATVEKAIRDGLVDPKEEHTFWGEPEDEREMAEDGMNFVKRKDGSTIDVGELRLCSKKFEKKS